MTLRDLILKGDAHDVRERLDANSAEANDPIPISSTNRSKVHPIHFVCDCIFEGKLDSGVGERIVRLLVDAGSDINATPPGIRDSPLISACSLLCDDIAIYLIRQGADVLPRGTHGGTCLHWACWTGSDRVVKELLLHPVDLEDRDNEFKCSPLLWAVDGLIHAKEGNRRNQRECILTVVKAGARIDSVNAAGLSSVEILRNNGHGELADEVSVDS